MKKNAKSAIVWFVLIGIVVFATYRLMDPKPPEHKLKTSEFYSLIRKKDSHLLFEGAIKIDKDWIRGRLSNSGQRHVISPPHTNWDGSFKTSRDVYSTYPLEEELIENQIRFDNEMSSNFPQWLVFVGSTVLPILLFLGIMIFISRQMQGAGNRAMSFGKSRAKLHGESQTNTTFDDVAGCDEAKEALVEVVEFLKDPKRFQRLGGRIPKGVLLMGPPGTGKTLLARAIAGEAEVPFYSISGSDFVEMFVGVGASRVRDLFETGKKDAPCIIFIDELDAVGRHRGAGIGGGHDEREQTLNQLLVSMDGFDSSEGLILIAATNRPDVLDPALLRPGRFDRQIVVDMPDVKGREELFDVHTKSPFKLSDDVDLKILARATPNFSGADVSNMANEAALLAAKQNKESVDVECFEEAKDRVMMGPERRSLVISPREREITAYHEAGHAILHHFIPESDPNYKCSIIPRGRAMGVTVALPTEERHNFGKKYLIGQITVLLGGRVAEEIKFDEQTTGAQNDFERSTDLARKMVTQWGMSELGPLAFGKNEQQIFLGKEMAHHKDYSESTALEIDHAVQGIVTDCYHRAKSIITSNSSGLRHLAEELLEKETLINEEITAVLGPRPQTSTSS